KPSLRPRTSSRRARLAQVPRSPSERAPSPRDRARLRGPVGEVRVRRARLRHHAQPRASRRRTAPVRRRSSCELAQGGGKQTFGGGGTAPAAVVPARKRVSAVSLGESVLEGVPG